ncbi:hypothetical protein Cabther_B0055 [Chloracidobacterium thermophilum B]|uniref:Uncharacterized protein n=1 Tax=Chloracidobacterium thermophilum (strain B) TaxID=981222 RepID=G2LJP4_CHLTF|nr:hypothetical protein Cabther_B0055 [Chloracidobacterium thermophilum B]
MFDMVIRLLVMKLVVAYFKMYQMNR